MREIREGERWIVAGSRVADERVRAEPFEAVELGLARWWIAAAPAA